MWRGKVGGGKLRGRAIVSGREAAHTASRPPSGQPPTNRHTWPKAASPSGPPFRRQDPHRPMAVYTEVTDDALAAFLADYDIGTMVAFRGIAEGVENSNFSLRTTTGDFILTLYEKRVDPAELPWFLGLMDASGATRHHLPAAGARPRRRGAALPVRPPRRDHHVPAGHLAAPGAGRSIARPSVRHSPRCTSPGAATRRPAPTPSARMAGRRCSPAAWMARTRHAKDEADDVAPGSAANSRPPSLASSPSGPPSCRSAISMPICFPTTCSSSTASCPG